MIYAIILFLHLVSAPTKPLYDINAQIAREKADVNLGFLNVESGDKDDYCVLSYDTGASSTTCVLTAGMIRKMKIQNQ